MLKRAQSRHNQHTEQVIVKFADGRKMSFIIDISAAKSMQDLKKHIIDHLKGKEIPPNAAIEIRKNGFVLRDYHEVKHGDTLWISEVRHGLQGGMKSFQIDKPIKDKQRQVKDYNKVQPADNSDRNLLDVSSLSETTEVKT